TGIAIDRDRVTDLIEHAGVDVMISRGKRTGPGHDDEAVRQHGDVGITLVLADTRVVYLCEEDGSLRSAGGPYLKSDAVGSIFVCPVTIGVVYGEIAVRKPDHFRLALLAGPRIDRRVRLAHRAVRIVDDAVDVVGGISVGDHITTVGKRRNGA